MKPAHVTAGDPASALEHLRSTEPDGSLNFLADPGATETVGCWLAEQLLPYEPDSVLIWDDPQTAVLAHIVARELGCATVMAVQWEGLVKLLSAPAGVRGVLLAASFPTDNSFNALIGVARSSGMSVLAAAAVTSGVPLTAAASAAGCAVVTLPRTEGGTA